MATQTASKTKWGLDPMHSELGFKVRHLVISTVSGTFGDFNVEAETEGDDFSTAKVKVTAKTATVNTNNNQRDEHLRSDDFFNSEKFPEMTFESKAVNKKSDTEFELTGTLTIRDTSKEVKFMVEMGGIAKDPYGNTKAGFEISGKVNRKEFGLKWNGITEAGQVVVADEIKIQANVQLAKAE